MDDEETEKTGPDGFEKTGGFRQEPYLVLVALVGGRAGGSALAAALRVRGRIPGRSARRFRSLRGNRYNRLEGAKLFHSGFGALQRVL